MEAEQLVCRQLRCTTDVVAESDTEETSVLVYDLQLLSVNRLVTLFLGGSGVSDEDQVAYELSQSGATERQSSRLWFPQ